MGERGPRVWVRLWAWWVWAWVWAGACGGAGALYCYSYRSAVAVWPAGDQLLRYGQPLRLYCLLDPGLDAARASFTNGSQPLPDHLVRRLNDSALLLDVPRPDRQDSMYFCRYGDEWCNSKVVVDSEPGPVQDFKCRSYNLENLTCSWTYSHYVRTNFSLYVMSNGIMLRDSCHVTYLNWDYACTFRELSGETNIDFLLNISNELGSYNETFHINQHEVVIPAKPYNLIFENITEDGVDLSWRLDSNLIMLDKAVVHKIQYQIYQLDNISSWHVVEGGRASVRALHDTQYAYRLRRLPYANWRYEVRVYVRSALAPDAPPFWSDYAYNTTIRTRARPPNRSPPLAPGGFDHLYSANSSQRRDIYLYWTEIEKYEENGDNFTYRITVKQDSDKWVAYPCQSSSYVQIERASLSGMEVCVESVNSVGVSQPCSRLWVPAQADVLGPAASPDQFTTVVYDNDTYELSWQKPTLPAGFDNYTLFWCYNDSPNLCKTGGFNFTSLPSDRTNHTIQLVPAETSKKYQFAIAVNSGGSSTGMTWANCKLANGRIAVKARIERDEVGARYVAFHWTLDCKYRDGDILGYNVSYCPLSRNFTCDAHRLRSQFVPHAAAPAPPHQRLRLADLVPYTMYRFTVTVKSIHGFAAGDNSMNVTTLPDRPSPPLQLALLELGATHAALRWDAPHDRYGKIVKYVVTWRWAGGEGGATLEHPPPEHVAANATLRPLHSFTNYSVTVLACNGLDPKFCSEPSRALHFRTAVGAPSPVARPRLLPLPDHAARRRLSWSPPLYPGGALDFYQVRYNRSDREDSEIYNVTDNFIDVEWCKYKGVQSEWFQVRGVNVDAESRNGARVWAGGELEGAGGELSGAGGEEGAARSLPGAWSDAVTSKCPHTMDAYLVWTSSCILCTGVIALMLYGSWRAWNRFKEMADLKPVLPPSMEDIIDKEKNVKSSLGRTAPAKSKEERHRASSADEALLLPAGAGELAPAAAAAGAPRATGARGASPPPSAAPSTAPPSPACSLASDGVSPAASAPPERPSCQPGAPALPLPAPASALALALAPAPRVAPGYIRPWSSNILQPPNLPDSFDFDDKIEELESLEEEMRGADRAAAASKERSGYVVCAPTRAPQFAHGKGAPPIPSGYLRATERAAPAALPGKLAAPQPPAGPPPAPQEYCRFGWSEDPACDNLHALLAPPAHGHHAAATLTTAPAPAPAFPPATAPHHAS